MKKLEAEKFIAEKVAAFKAQLTVLRKGQFNVLPEAEGQVIDLHKRKSDDAKIVEFQKRADDLLIVSTLMGKPVKELNLYKSFKKYLETTELAKAMTTTGSGSGLEWVPTDFSAELIDKVQLELRVAALFPRINMPTDPFKMPGKSSFSTARKGTQGSAPDASTVGTTQITLSTSKIIDYVPVTYELDEDSIIAMLPTVKDDIANSIARAQENCVINGDTTPTHMDSDVTAADAQERCWMGLRKLALANNYKTDISTFNLEALNNLITHMGIYGAIPSKLAIIVGTTGLGKIRVMKDSSGNPVMTTMDKLGPRATVLTGMVGSVLGIPVITSEFVRENLNASGVYDGSVTTYTALHLVRTDGFVFGDRRKIMVEVDRNIKSQTIDIVASARMDFEPRYAIASNKTTWMGYKL